MSKVSRTLILTLIFLLALGACSPFPALPVTEPEPSEIYFPLVQNEYDPPPLGGVTNEHMGWKLLAPYYLGQFLKIPVSAGFVDQLGLEYIPPRIEGFDGQIFLNIHGGFREWTGGAYCLPIPETLWSNWVDELAIPVIEQIGSNRIWWFEIGNEPETTSTYYELYLGCWGDQSDYQAGVYYARFSNYVYSRLKKEYPHIAIIGGAFSNDPGEFARGVSDTFNYIEKQTHRLAIDGISFHAYVYPETDFGGVTKREKAFGDLFSNRLLYLSETSMICKILSVECLQGQANYFTWLPQNLKGVVLFSWYTLGCNGWANTDMILPCDPSNIEDPLHLKPVWYSYFNYMESIR